MNIVSFIRPLPHLHPAIRGLSHMLINSDAPDTVGNDVAGGWVLDVFDVAADVGLNGGILEHAVAGGIEAAVLQHQAVGVAEQLLSGQAAVHQTHVLGVPGQIFAVDY